MSNIFDDLYPEFIETDSRNSKEGRPLSINSPYVISSNLQHRRFSCYFNNINLTGKTVLDIGSATGALGAWVLHHGAALYQGLEINPDLANTSEMLLRAHFNESRFNIKTDSLEDAQFNQTFDIVILSGVLSTSYSYFEYLKKYADLAKVALIVEADWPQTFTTSYHVPEEAAKTEDALFAFLTGPDGPETVWYYTNRSIWSGDIKVWHPRNMFSVNALKNIIESIGWKFDLDEYRQSWKCFPELYNVYLWKNKSETDTHIFNSRILIKCTTNTKEHVTGFLDAFKQRAQNATNQSAENLTISDTTVTTAVN